MNSKKIKKAKKIIPKRNYEGPLCHRFLTEDQLKQIKKRLGDSPLRGYSGPSLEILNFTNDKNSIYEIFIALSAEFKGIKLSDVVGFFEVARDIKLIKIDKVSFISEWILIAEGLSDVQVRSISNSVEGELREKANVEPIRKEGVNEAKWALLDYGDLIVNIFQPEIRKYYDLESFWSNGDNLLFP